MISYKNSIKILKKSKINIGNEIIKVNSCLNRVTANNIFSKVNNPAADNAAFDGFVINSKDTKNLRKTINQILQIIIILITILINLFNLSLNLVLWIWQII